jgi:uncharacterized protein YoxC
MHGSMVVDSMLRHIESYQAQSILALFLIVLVIFVMTVIAFRVSRRLRNRVDELTRTVNGLTNQQEARYTRELIGRAKDKDKDPA